MALPETDGDARLPSMSLEVDREQERLRALSHPTRLRILSLLTGASMSSAELAREMGMSQAAVSFHVRQLAGVGYLELVEERSKRGGKERLYRHLPVNQEQLESDDPQMTVRAVATELGRRLAIEPSQAWRLFSDAEAWVPLEVWTSVSATITDAMMRLHAAAQPPRSTGTVHVSATSLLFDINDADSTIDV